MRPRREATLSLSAPVPEAPSAYKLGVSNLGKSEFGFRRLGLAFTNAGHSSVRSFRGPRVPEFGVSELGPFGHRRLRRAWCQGLVAPQWSSDGPLKSEVGCFRALPNFGSGTSDFIISLVELAEFGASKSGIRGLRANAKRSHLRIPETMAKGHTKFGASLSAPRARIVRDPGDITFSASSLKLIPKASLRGVGARAGRRTHEAHASGLRFSGLWVCVDGWSAQIGPRAPRGVAATEQWRCTPLRRP